MTHTPMVVIVGETGSGKTALALELAQRFNGEIICADSRTVYKGMDIGTAKPTLVEQAMIPHYGLDLVQPDQRFTVADFKLYADRTIRAIADRGKLPIMVGGTGLYVDAVLYDYQFRTNRTGDRQTLEALSVDTLQQRLHSLGIPLPANARNPRHLIRAIETNGQTSIRSELRPQTLLLGMQVDREQLHTRLEQRVDTMLQAGLLQEAAQLSARYGWDCEALRSPGYKELQAVIMQNTDVSIARAEIVKNHQALAKRQRTWFKRNKSIHWLTTSDKHTEAVDLTTTFVNK